MISSSEVPARKTTVASIVIPVFNEQDSIESLFQRLGSVVAKLSGYQWELVLVDDGSSDRTVELIQQHRVLFPGQLRLVQFSRNFGHQPALLAGLAQSSGEVIIVIDADLQDPPELFGDLLARYEEGNDVVYAIRRSREGAFYMRWAYAGFYRFMDAMTEIRIPLDSGDFGLMTRRVAQLLVEYPDKDLFLRGLRSWVGFRQAGLPYDRPKRAAGETKYTFSKLLKLAGSGIFGYSSLPLRISTFLGLAAIALCVVYGVYALVGKLIYNSNPPGWTSLVLVVLALGGAQLVSVGILGEYIARIYKQIQPRPHYVVKDSKTL
ncbi:MAG TPA: glycosyltransferase family 2 protein [Candidatus Methylacidiphilales bacterium]|jgi:dolichol-phosphate mannosyltransferase|nr:glycosyltransferase family 2 protein [Candidatus Methylacidiphilales bacterium]